MQPLYFLLAFFALFLVTHAQSSSEVTYSYQCCMYNNTGVTATGVYCTNEPTCLPNMTYWTLLEQTGANSCAKCPYLLPNYESKKKANVLHPQPRLPTGPFPCCVYSDLGFIEFY